MKIPLKIDSLAMASNSTKIVDLMELLKGCVQRQIHEIGRGVLSEFKMLGTISTPEVFHLKPEPFGHHVSIIYTQTTDCSKFGKKIDPSQHYPVRSCMLTFLAAHFRRNLHRAFLLPENRPYFRRVNRYTFEEDVPTSGPLLNVHMGVKPSSNYSSGSHFTNQLNLAFF